jgi:hypothetical protein
MLAAATTAAGLSVWGVIPRVVLSLQSFHLRDVLYLWGCADRAAVGKSHSRCVVAVLKKANTWRSNVTEAALRRLVNTCRKSMEAQVRGKVAVVKLLPIRIHVRQECRHGVRKLCILDRTKKHTTSSTIVVVKFYFSLEPEEEQEGLRKVEDVVGIRPCRDPDRDCGIKSGNGKFKKAPQVVVAVIRFEPN